MAMNRKTIKSNEASKGQPQGRSLPGELSSLILRTVEHIGHTGNFNINEKFHYLNSYIKLLTKYITEKDIENALKVQASLDIVFYNLTGKPLYLEWAAKRGGRADKRKKGIRLAIKELLPKIKGLSPRMAWRFFKREYPSSKPFIVGEYEIYFGPDSTGNESDDLLIQTKDFKDSSIKYKTFEKYFYQVLKENTQTGG
jgi:hypothetical protein